MDRKDFYKQEAQPVPRQTDNNRSFDPAAALISHRIDPMAEIMEPPVLIHIKYQPIATLGNFSLLIGKAKSRKTFSVSCLTAAAASGSCSLEGIRGNLKAASKILYFDTEQSPFHAQRTVKRICKQIGQDKPVNLDAFGLRPLEPKERWITIDHAIANTPGLAMVVIDGIVDLLTHGVNDEEEATRLTTALLCWTQNYNIHIITVLHQNKADFNARGHIGTYLVNKAESVLSVTKDPKHNDISVVESVYCRDKDFQPFAFTINEEGLPVLIDASPPETSKWQSISDIMEKILQPLKAMTRGHLESEYMKHTGNCRKTASNHIKYAVENGILLKDEAAKSYKLYHSAVHEEENKLFSLYPNYEDAPF